MTWPIVRLGEVADTALGKMLDKAKVKGHAHVPYLRNVNVQWGRIDTDDLLTMELAEDERERFAVRAGDLLVCEGGEIGRCAIWHGRTDYLAYQKALHRIRPSDRLDTQFLRYLMEHHSLSGQLAKLATGTTIAHLPQQQLRRVPVPLPSLDEQRRIVDLLEDHLSRLDAATAYLDAGCRRAALLLHSARESIWEVAQDRASIAELGEVVTGKTPPTRDLANSGDEVPFVTPGDLAHGDVLGTVHRSISEHGALSSRTVEEGSVLTVCIGATLGKVGYTEGRVAFNQQINAVRLTTVDEARLLAAAMAAPTFQRKMREASSATTMPILNKSSFSRLLVPRVPSAAREGLLDRIRESSEAVERLRKELDVGISRSAALRRSLLAAAFSGRLITGAESDLPAAEEMINA